MKLFLGIISFILVPVYLFFNKLEMNFLILPKEKLNKQFSIVGSVSKADSINDQYARPLYSSKNNQYYFKEFNNYIILMEPNIGINYNLTGLEEAIDDRIIYRLTKVISFANYIIFDIDPLVKKSFFFKMNRKNLFTEKNLHYITDNQVVNIDVNYYDKTIKYSLYFHDETTYKPKISNLKHGYFITLSNIYNNNGSKISHYISRWDCDKDIDMYIDKSIPVEFLDTFKEGIEIWNKALKKADERCNINAITYKSSAWSKFKYGDARFSSISLSPSSLDSTYAVGHMDFDWRNGKIFRGNIMVSGKWIDFWSNIYNYLDKIRQINHNKTSYKMCINNIYSKNYSNQMNFIKRGLKSVVIHEMGHILGLRHNFKASSLVNYNDIFDKDRIRNEGLIPSIMDYLSFIINSKNIYSCLTDECIFENIEIMDDIGFYDKQTIMFGYGKNKVMEYHLGPDEFLNDDPLSQIGDISSSPSLYYNDDLEISKYVIENFNIIPKKDNDNFESSWKEEGKLIITHMKKLVSYLQKSIATLVHISYNFDGDVMNTIQTQSDAVKFIKNITKGRYFIDDKKYFIYDDCDIKDIYICQGMTSFDLIQINIGIMEDIESMLNSPDFRNLIEKNYFITNKTIPFDFLINEFGV